jgi:hypothetical protein
MDIGASVQGRVSDGVSLALTQRECSRISQETTGPAKGEEMTKWVEGLGK